MLRRQFFLTPLVALMSTSLFGKSKIKRELKKCRLYSIVTVLDKSLFYHARDYENERIVFRYVDDPQLGNITKEITWNDQQKGDTIGCIDFGDGGHIIAAQKYTVVDVMLSTTTPPEYKYYLIHCKDTKNIFPKIITTHQSTKVFLVNTTMSK